MDTSNQAQARVLLYTCTRQAQMCPGARNHASAVRPTEWVVRHVARFCGTRAPLRPRPALSMWPRRASAGRRTSASRSIATQPAHSAPWQRCVPRGADPVGPRALECGSRCRSACLLSCQQHVHVCLRMTSILTSAWYKCASTSTSINSTHNGIVASRVSLLYECSLTIVVYTHGGARQLPRLFTPPPFLVLPASG